jgi:predicted RNase H-like nuclease
MNTNLWKRTIAGVDGCKRGWVVVSHSPDGNFAVKVFPQFAAVLEDVHDVIVVDIPIGLLDKGTRMADCAARRALKGRSCCVFTAPLRPMLASRDYSEANACRQRIEGKGLTKQAWAILAKIAEVDQLVTPERQARIKEGHPEVSFAYMNRGQALHSSKHTTEGHQARITLLTIYFPNIASLVQEHERIAEDVVDAFAMLWTAQRVSEGRALALPGEPQRDSRGLLMQIWA